MLKALNHPPSGWKRRVLRYVLAAGLIVSVVASAETADPLESALRFRVDREGYLKQFDPIFLRPIREGQNALPVGNGDLAAVIWQPEDLVVMLNKCDVGGTSQVGRLRIETPVKLADRVGRLTSRLSLYEATADVTYEGGKLPGSAGWVWRGRYGRAPKPEERDQGTVRVRAWVPNGQNVFLLKYEEEGKTPHELTVFFERWVQKEFGGEVTASVKGDALAIVYEPRTEADAQPYAAVLAFDGFAGALLEEAGDVGAKLSMPAAQKFAGRIAVAVVTQAEDEDYLQAATKLARATLREDETELRAQHLSYWRSFWGKLFVDAGHPYLTALYHLALYELGITSRGARPVKFNGALNLWNERYRVWGAGYWCHNQTESYLPVYAANHPELADNFHDWIARVRPEAVKLARKRFSTEGAHYAEVMTHDFQTGDDVKPLDPKAGGTQWILSSGVRYALMMWDRYRYTLDDAFLREKAYPVIRDCADFYANYGKLGRDGRYHVAPTISWEEPPVGSDSHPDCAAWRAILATAIQAAELLGGDEGRLTVWGDRLTKAPPFPVHDGLFSTVTRTDGRPEPTSHFQWQLPNLSGVFPYGVIGLDSDPKLRRLAEDTFLRYRYNADAGHEFLPVIAARLGRSEWWRGAMFQYLQYFQVYDQGLFNYYNIHGNRDKGCGNSESLHPYLEGSGVMATGTNEMLLQSYDGTIRVFPATPERWHARFILRAAGSLMVASERRGRDGIPYIAIQPVGGAERVCRVAVPWEGRANLTEDGRKGRCKNRNGMAEFVSTPGRVYVLMPKGKSLRDVPMVEAKFERQYSPCRLGNVWIGSREGANSHTASFPLW